MSSMAGEIAARMREDGIDPAGPGDQVPMVDVPNTEGVGGPRAPVPGNDGGYSAPPVADPSAGTQITDTPAGGEPGPIPYARFKEVNDRYAALRGYEELASAGYDSDSLGRLAAFEAQYIRDPKGTIGALVDGLEDLPPEARSAILQHLGVDDDTAVGPGQGAFGEGDGSVTSQLSPEDRELLDWARERRTQESTDRVNAEQNQRLDVVVNAWKAKDNEEGVQTLPDHRLYAFISAAAARGGFQTLEELSAMARSEWLDERERILREAYQGSRRDGMPPPSLPGSGATGAPPQRPRTLSEASKLARAAMERGELPQ